jgi:hypothetical protein
MIGDETCQRGEVERRLISDGCQVVAQPDLLNGVIGGVVS